MQLILIIAGGMLGLWLGEASRGMLGMFAGAVIGYLYAQRRSMLVVTSLERPDTGRCFFAIHYYLFKNMWEKNLKKRCNFVHKMTIVLT